MIKILAFDIETAPNTAHVWGLFKQNIGLNQILHTGRVMCFSAAWLNPKNLRPQKVDFVSEFHDGHDTTIQRAWQYLDEADAVVTYNGEGFDFPTLNREFLKYELVPPTPYASIDLLRTTKRQFRFASNKLDHLLKELKIGQKRKHEGHELWIKCMAGDAKAWEVMRAYNMQDVKETAKLYRRILPWIQNHPNRKLYDGTDRPICPKCGGKHVQSRGIARTKVFAYSRYQCSDCGSWFRGRKNVLPKNYVDFS